LARLNYRGVAVIVPQGAALQALLERIDDGTGRRVLDELPPAARDAMRRVLAAAYLTGVKEGVDRALALEPAQGEQRGPTPAPAGVVNETPEPEPHALREIREQEGKGVRSPLRTIIERYKRSELRLPSIPETAMRLNRLLADPDFDLQEVLEVVRMDPMLSARLLALASSPFYSRGGRSARSLQDAVVRLGSRELAKFLLGMANQRLFELKSKRREAEAAMLWQHSLATALAAECFAGEVPDAHPPVYFLHGLLHDIGRALLIQIFDELENEPDATPIAEEEMDRTTDSLHGQFGAVLLQKWRFDESFGEVSRFHHQPQKSFSNMKLVSAVSVADALATRLGYGTETMRDIPEALEEHPASVLLGLDKDTIEYASAHVRKGIETFGASRAP
jgi:putative nucleotidyltransferase with HDIG domain